MNHILLCFLAILTVTSAFAKSDKKNILFIAVDDLNDWTGAFGGHPQSHTPNIDALAKKGLAFQKAYSASPVCSPSRTALLTGRRPHETGVDRNGVPHFRNSSQKWLKNVVTLPQYFSHQGYHTEAIGKIFHKPGEGKGEFIVNAKNPGGTARGKNMVRVQGSKLVWSESHVDNERTSDWRKAIYASDFLSKNHKDPFFLAVGIFRPHLPWHAPKAFYDLLPATKDIQLPDYLKDDLKDTSAKSNNVLSQVLKQGGKALWQESVRAYLANSAYADNAIGKIIDSLAASAYAKNTIVVLWGDHGWHLGEKNHFQKFTLWERASRTSFIIYDPSMKASGNINKAVSLQDIYPTLIDLAGLKPPKFIVRGRSLKPLMENPRGNWQGAALVSYRGNHGIFSDDLHFIDRGNGELYDLNTDPNEWVNRINDSDYQEKKAAMKKALDLMLKKHEENPFGAR